MARHLYTPEEETFLRSYIPGHTLRETAAAASQRFGWAMTPGQVKSYSKNHHVPTGLPSGIPAGQPSKLWPAEARAYVAEHVKGHSMAELTEMLQRDLGLTYTYEQVKSYTARNGLTNGRQTTFPPGHVPWSKGRKMPPNANSQRTQFKAGEVPWNKLPLGSVIKKTDGYLWRKVGPGARDWRQEHILRWEEANGPLPPGDRLIFLDGNRGNLELSNLRAVSNDILLELNRRGLRFDDADLTQTGVLIAELSRSVFQQKNKKKRR